MVRKLIKAKRKASKKESEQKRKAIESKKAREK
jgi:hypothetical protein